MKKITVLTVDKDGRVDKRDIVPALDVLQSLCGGPIERVQLDKDTCAFVNEEGRLRDLYATKHFTHTLYPGGPLTVRGPFFLHRGKGACRQSLTDEQIKRWTEYLESDQATAY